MLRQSRWIPAVKRRLLGEGLLDRVRNASIGLFGLTTAVGLLLVAVSVNQTWQTLPGLPIPGAPFERGADLDAQSAEEATHIASGTRPAHPSHDRSSSSGDEAGQPSPKPDSGPATVEPVGVRVSTPVQSGGQRRSSEPTEGPAAETSPSPTPSPSTPAPIAAVPPPTSSPPHPSERRSGGRGPGGSKGGGHESHGGPPPSKAAVTTEKPPPSQSPASDDEEDEEADSSPPSSERGPRHGHWAEER